MVTDIFDPNHFSGVVYKDGSFETALSRHSIYSSHSDFVVVKTRSSTNAYRRGTSWHRGGSEDAKEPFEILVFWNRFLQPGDILDLSDYRPDYRLVTMDEWSRPAPHEWDLSEEAPAALHR